MDASTRHSWRLAGLSRVVFSVTRGLTYGFLQFITDTLAQEGMATLMGFVKHWPMYVWFVAFSNHCFRFPVSAVGPKTPGLALVIMPSRAERG